MKLKHRNTASRQQTIYKLALGGIAAALAVLFVWLSVVVRFTTVAFYIAAGCALMVPITRRYYLSSIAAFAVSAALSFVIAGDIFVVIGYVLYFGPMSIITAICAEHKVKQYISLPLKLVYINGVLAVLYFVFGTIVVADEIIDKIDYWMVALIGSVALLVIDFAMQYIYRCMSPIVSKALRLNQRVSSGASADQKVNANHDNDDIDDNRAEEKITDDDDGDNPFDLDE